jgi:Family of unknown function (DUF6152)
MRRTNAITLTMLTVVLWSNSAAAHHSFAPVYDGNREITVTGVVTQFKFVNPHAMMLMDVTDESGKVVKWTVEFAGSLNLSEVGWTADSIKAKERVTVTGNPTHTGSHGMFFRKLVRSDGTELLNSGLQRTKDIEEERLQRQRARAQQK